MLGQYGAVNLVTAVVFIGALVLFGSIATLAGGGADSPHARLRRRLNRVARPGLAANLPKRAGPADAKASLRRDTPTGRFKGLELLLRRALPGREKLMIRLERTGKKITLTRYAAVCLGVGVVTAFAVEIFLMPPVALALIAGLVAAVIVPHLAVGWMISRRVNAFIAQLPEAIDLIVRGLRSGLPVMESIATVGRDLADPIGSEFYGIAESIRLGRSIEEVLWETAGRLKVAEFNFLVISVAVQRETGGNLAETLNNLSDIIRRRQQMKLKVRAMSSEARASAYILGSLPFIMAVALYFINPGYIAKLFADPRGLVMIGAGLLSQATGALVMAKMVRFEI